MNLTRAIERATSAAAYDINGGWVVAYYGRVYYGNGRHGFGILFEQKCVNKTTAQKIANDFNNTHMVNAL